MSVNIQPQFTIVPLGTGALTVEFGNYVSLALNSLAIGLSSVVEKERFPGFIESVPAYSSVSVFYDVVAVRHAFPQFASGYEAVSSVVTKLVQKISSGSDDSREFRIGVSFGGKNGPDLDEVAAHSGLTTDSVVTLFTAAEYRVFMLGFLPGFAYMGEVDERIATPRKETPRILVPQGSIGIAGRQTGIYPTDSPGGWQLIGRTDFGLFERDSSPPTVLQPGDRVRFFPIKECQFT